LKEVVRSTFGYYFDLALIASVAKSLKKHLCAYLMKIVHPVCNSSNWKRPTVDGSG
jgi:hypothetical protein